MPIDSSIYQLIGRGVKSIPELDNEYAQAKSNKIALALNQAKLDDHTRTNEEARSINDAYKGATGADGKIDRNSLYTRIAAGGQGSKLPTIQKGFADQDAAEATRKKAEIEAHLKKFEVSGQIMNGVTDQATWELARQKTAEVFGPEAAAQMPTQYDPALVEQKRRQALTVKDQLEQEWKGITHKLEVEKFGELKRHNTTVEGETGLHNRNTEKTAAGQLRVAQGNLKLRGDEHETAKGNLVAESGGPTQMGLVKKFGKPEKGYRWKEDGTAEPIPGGSAATGKALPTKLITDLTEQSQVADTTERLKNTFTDNFAGKSILGDWSNTFKRISGDDTGQSQWWQDYALHESTIRNKLFGASLTPGEQEQWQRLTITPRMNPDQARQNLQRRAELEARGLERLTTSSAKAGYNKDQIEALTGRPIGAKPAQPTPPAGAPAAIKSDAEYNALPSGTEFVGPDGKKRRKP